MSSPFPGMDPYLEKQETWQDFHQAFCPALRDALVSQVRPRYLVKLEEHLYLHEPDGEKRLLGRGDVTLTDADRGSYSAGATAVATASSTIGLLELELDEERSTYVEILDRYSREVVTVIELLSPANKEHGANRAQYLGKRLRRLHGPAHFVEIDLLRGGPRVPLRGLPECDYYAMVSRAEMRPRVELWPFRLRDPLPTIPIPLRAPDADAVLDLKTIFNRVYDGAGYVDYVHEQEPTPPLGDDDRAWTAGRLGRVSESSPA